jgi:hypothetical protein
MTAAERRWFLQPISVPLQKEPLEPHALQAAAAALVAKNPRSFEAFWDGSKLELCFGSSTSWDLDLALKRYRQHVKVGLPASDEFAANARMEGGALPVPSWLPKLDPTKTRFFFVGNEQAHCFAVFDTRKTGLLMTPLLITLQRSRFAWVQFEWFEADLRRSLMDLKSVMFSRWKEIDTPIQKTHEWTDSSGKSHSNTMEEDHVDKYGEFHTHHDRLSAHIDSKVSSRLVAMIIRGVTDLGDRGVGQLPFGMIEDAGDVRRGRWLGPSQGSSLGGDSKLGECLRVWWSDDPRMLVDLATRRAFDVHESVGSYVRDYLPWRHSLPFVILGSEEMGLLVHPPSSNVNGLRITRNSELPSPPSGRRAEKPGIQITEA